MKMKLKNKIKMRNFSKIYYNNLCREDLEKHFPNCLIDIILGYLEINTNRFKKWNKHITSIRTIGSKPNDYIYFLKSDKYKELMRQQAELRHIEWVKKYGTVEENERKDKLKEEKARRNLDAFHLYLFNMNK
jgi:hypothetical protein